MQRRWLTLVAPTLRLHCCLAVAAKVHEQTRDELKINRVSRISFGTAANNSFAPTVFLISSVSSDPVRYLDSFFCKPLASLLRVCAKSSSASSTNFRRIFQPLCVKGGEREKEREENLAPQSSYARATQFDGYELQRGTGLSNNLFPA